MNTIEINKRTGAIVEDDKVIIQQEKWNGKEFIEIVLTKADIIALAEKLKEEKL